MKFTKDELWLMKDHIEEVMWELIREKDEAYIYSDFELAGFDTQINSLQNVIYLIEDKIKE